MKKVVMIFMVLAMILLSGCSGSSDNGNNNANTGNNDPNKVVEFKDSELEKLVRAKLDKAEGDILVSDMEELYSLNINNQETPVKDLTGLEYAVNLNDFSYRYGEDLKSLDPVSKLQNLTYMTVSYSTLASPPTTIFDTPLLARVNFIQTEVGSGDFLKNLTAMTDLTMSDTGLTSIEFVKNMDKLERLGLEYNSISDITPVKNKHSLTSINLHKNQVVDISALETCEELEYINISYNHVQDISCLYDLENLEELRAYEDLDKKIINRSQIQALISSGVEVNYHE